MDIYSTTALNRLVQSLKRPQTALLGAFFGQVETSDTEDIKFDVENKKRRIAPFVSPLREGKLVEDEGYVTGYYARFVHPQYRLKGYLTCRCFCFYQALAALYCASVSLQADTLFF